MRKEENCRCIGLQGARDDADGIGGGCGKDGKSRGRPCRGRLSCHYFTGFHAGVMIHQ